MVLKPLSQKKEPHPLTLNPKPEGLLCPAAALEVSGDAGKVVLEGDVRNGLGPGAVPQKPGVWGLRFRV